MTHTTTSSYPAHVPHLNRPPLYRTHRPIKMQRPIAVVLTLLLCFQSVVSFLLPTPIVVRSATAPARGAGAVQMNGVTDAITSYVGIWSPTIRTYVVDQSMLKRGKYVGIDCTATKTLPSPCPSTSLSLNAKQYRGRRKHPYGADQVVPCKRQYNKNFMN